MEYSKDVEELFNKVVPIDMQEEFKEYKILSKQHKKERQKIYAQKPEVIERRKEREKINYQRPEVKKRRKEYYQRPEVKEKRRVKQFIGDFKK